MQYRRPIRRKPVCLVSPRTQQPREGNGEKRQPNRKGKADNAQRHRPKESARFKVTQGNCRISTLWASFGISTLASDFWVQIFSSQTRAATPPRQAVESQIDD